MKVQDLIGEVAKRHNVLVDPSDPVFIAVTLNELLLEEHVAKLLSPHKRPREVHFVEELPRNAMGKVQKAKLSRP